MVDLTVFAAALAGLERTLVDVGLWDVEEPTAEQIAKAGAFGSDTMTFGQWLRWILVLRAHQTLEAGSLPGSSNVAAYAARELDGAPFGDRLLEALVAFDAAVEDN
jgi:uncharacterized protein YqcC (DUF446 family)